MIVLLIIKCEMISFTKVASQLFGALFIDADNMQMQWLWELLQWTGFK